jgi:2-oxoglutarate ferredoxin oxidoreductase subunit beta
MHDGSLLNFRSVPEGYNPTDRQSVMAYISQQQSKGEILTGILFVDESVPDLHEMNNSSEIPFSRMPYGKLCPGAAALDELQEEFR